MTRQHTPGPYQDAIADSIKSGMSVRRVAWFYNESVEYIAAVLLEVAISDARCVEKRVG